MKPIKSPGLRLRRTGMVSIMLATAFVAWGGPAQAGYPAAYWKARTLRVPFDNCQALRTKAMRSAGFKDVEVDANEARGTSGQARGFATCVRLPRAGACKRDGATFMMVVAGNDANEAHALLDKVDRGAGDPILFDCN